MSYLCERKVRNPGSVSNEFYIVSPASTDILMTGLALVEFQTIGARLGTGQFLQKMYCRISSVYFDEHNIQMKNTRVKIHSNSWESLKVYFRRDTKALADSVAGVLKLYFEKN